MSDPHNAHGGEASSDAFSTHRRSSMVQTHNAHGGETSSEAAFSGEEWQEFQKSDVQVGATFVILIASIFMIGLLLYSWVLYEVAAVPMT